MPTTRGVHAVVAEGVLTTRARRGTAGVVLRRRAVLQQDLFDKAGVAYPTSSWTWTDEMAAAKKLTTRAPASGDFQPVTYNEYYKALDQAGGSFLSADGTRRRSTAQQGSRRPTGSSASRARRCRPLTADRQHAELRHQPVQDGKLAMWHNGNWQFSGLAKMPGWDVAVEPGDTSRRAPCSSTASRRRRARSTRRRVEVAAVHLGSDRR